MRGNALFRKSTVERQRTSILILDRHEEQDPGFVIKSKVQDTDAFRESLSFKNSVQ